MENSIKTILMLVNAGTPINNDSTRCVLQYYLTFGQTGKMSGAVFNMYMLEKMRVSSTDKWVNFFELRQLSIIIAFLLVPNTIFIFSITSMILCTLRKI